jgi:4a-hydroxytetrahydrobiopterin dehydratase
MALLTPTEIQSQLKQHPGWQLASGEIVRSFEFSGFTQAIAFVNQVADAAENANHHPDIDIRYNKVRLALASHDAGGLTAADFKLAAAIDSI